MNTLPFPAKLIKTHGIHTIALSEFTQQELPQASKRNAANFMKFLKQQKQQIVAQTVKQADIKVACWLRFDRPIEQTLELFLSYHNQQGHWLQILDSEKIHQKNSVMLSGNIEFHPGLNLTQVELAITHAPKLTVFVDDLSIKITKHTSAMQNKKAI